MYQDKYGRYHDKPTDGAEPSSNNGWIYTAYAKQIGLDIDYDKLQECYQDCLVNLSMFYKINRSPNKNEPPISRDEIIGLASLGLLDVDKMEDQYFTFCNESNFRPKSLSKINWLKALYQLYKLKDKHRNAVWQEDGYEEAKQLAFRLKPDDIYYVKKSKWKEN